MGCLHGNEVCGRFLNKTHELDAIQSKTHWAHCIWTAMAYISVRAFGLELSCTHAFYIELPRAFFQRRHSAPYVWLRIFSKPNAPDFSDTDPVRFVSNVFKAKRSGHFTILAKRLVSESPQNTKLARAFWFEKGVLSISSNQNVWVRCEKSKNVLDLFISSQNAWGVSQWDAVC